KSSAPERWEQRRSLQRRRGRVRSLLRADALVVLVEAVFDQGGDGVERFARLLAGSVDEDGRARAGAQHHQPHDRAARHRGAVARDLYLGIEALGGAHKAGRRPGVQALAIHDGQLLRQRPAGICRCIHEGNSKPEGAQPPSDSLATLMYLRPASAAMVTACLISRSARTRASLTSMGRLTPAIIITEIARLEGVPPNISVRITTPSPLLAVPTAAMMSSRRASMSSSGPMQIVST